MSKGKTLAYDLCNNDLWNSEQKSYKGELDHTVTQHLTQPENALKTPDLRIAKNKDHESHSPAACKLILATLALHGRCERIELGVYVYMLGVRERVADTDSVE